jgi:hypothetical protein
VAGAARSSRQYWTYTRASGWSQARPDAVGTVSYKVVSPKALAEAVASLRWCGCRVKRTFFPPMIGVKARKEGPRPQDESPSSGCESASFEGQASSFQGAGISGRVGFTFAVSADGASGISSGAKSVCHFPYKSSPKLVINPAQRSPSLCRRAALGNRRRWSGTHPKSACPRRPEYV